MRIVLVEAGVRGIGAVVPHHPDASLGDDDVEGHQGRRSPVLDVGLLQGYAVDGQGACAIGGDAVTGDADHALDEVMSGVLGQQAGEDEPVAHDSVDPGRLLGVEPTARVREDDDIPAMHIMRVVHPHRDMILGLQGVLH